MEAIDAITAGRPWNNGVIYLYPLELKGHNNGTASTNNNNRTDNFGRNDGQFAAAAPTGQPRPGATGSTEQPDDPDFGFGFF